MFVGCGKLVGVMLFQFGFQGKCYQCQQGKYICYVEGCDGQIFIVEYFDGDWYGGGLFMDFV